MELTQSQDGPRVTVAVRGDLDLQSAPELLAVGQAALEQADVTTLVVDLSGLDFTDSTGLGAFVGLHSRAGDQNRELILHNPPDATARLLQLTGLDTVLTVT